MNLPPAYADPAYITPSPGSALGSAPFSGQGRRQERCSGLTLSLDRRGQRESSPGEGGL